VQRFLVGKEAGRRKYAAAVSSSEGFLTGPFEADCEATA